MENNLEAIRPDGLIEARHSLTAKENDIIDLVLSTIKEDGKYQYDIDLEKYKKAYSLGSTNVYRDLKKATDALYENHNKFSVKDRVTGREKKFVWFSMLDYIPKEGRIIFEIGDTLKTMMLEMKKRIYYRLEYPINFKSIYSKRIYYMLKSFEDTGWRIDNLDELKYKLNCPEGYKNYAIFKIKVLDMAFEEINKGSDISFTYKTIKVGRKVTGIKFYVKSNKAKIEVAATKEESELIQQVQDIFYKHGITKAEAKCILEDAKNNLAPIRECYAYILTKDVNDVIPYMRKLLKGFNKPHKNVANKVGGFNDYPQRPIDPSLEASLLGWNANVEVDESDFGNDLEEFRKQKIIK